MSKITQKMVKEVKANNKKTWHDAGWHAFNGRKETMAINFALGNCEKDASLGQIVEEAKKFLETIEE